MATSELLTSAQIQHQLSVTRFAAGEARKITPYLLEVIEYLEARIAKEGQTIASKKRLNILIADTKARLNTIFTNYEGDVFKSMLADVAANELEFQGRVVESVVTNYESVIPTVEQAVSAAKNNPLIIGAKGGAVDFTKYTTGWKQDEINRVASRISGGFYSGQTNAEIVRGVIGLKSQNYADGILNLSRNNIQSMVRTSINHMSTQAKEAFNKKNSDLVIGYTIVVTFDKDTSTICKGYGDGKVYLYSDGANQPLPPFHPNCRSTPSPVLSDEFDFLDKGATRASRGAEGGKQVSADLTYHEWLKSQPASFQDEALGKTKGLIFRNAGLSADEFKQATTDQFKNPLTIKQMAAKDKRIAEYLSKR